MNSSLSSPEGFSRIAIFLPSLNGGGAERVMVTLANAFAQRGYAVDLVLAVAEGPYLSQVSESVRIVDLNAGRVIKALLPLLRYLQRERPVAMLSAMTHANVVAILARMLARVPMRLVVSERTTISFEVKRAQDIAARLTYGLVPWLYPRADGVTVVSKAAAADLVTYARLVPSSVNVIYNPFDLARISQLANESIPHAWFGADQPPVVLAIGRLTEAKDYPTLIRAFSKLRVKRSARLLILGEGELRDSLEELLVQLKLTADEVQIPGFVANPFSYLARCNVFVLSSRWEGLPGTLIEAMACGTPVVSTDCPSGPREILAGGRWGSLVPVGDDNALAKAIDTVLSTPPQQMPNVRQRAADFGQENAVDAYINALGLTARNAIETE